MKKYSLFFLIAMAMVVVSNAQVITVTGGSGRVNNSTVFKGRPFTAQVTGLNGTPKQWAVGIGTANGQLVLNTSSTVISNAVVDRNLTGNTALISVGATNGRGVCRFLTAIEPPVPCTSRLNVNIEDCFFVDAVITPIPANYTSISWTISPTAKIIGGPTSKAVLNFNYYTTYQLTATVTGGVCDGETFTGSFNVRTCNGIPLGRGTSSVSMSPNPVNGDQLKVRFDGDAASFQFSILSSAGQVVDEKVGIQKQGGEAVLDVSKLLPGTYYIQLDGEAGDGKAMRFVVN